MSDKKEKGVSPYGENGKLTETTTFTLEDGTDDGVEVTMTVDINLDGNTGAVTFTQKGPVVLPNMASIYGGSVPPTIVYDDIPVGGKVQELITKDSNGVVASNYNNVIENVKEKITANGGDPNLFTEKLLDDNLDD